MRIHFGHPSTLLRAGLSTWLASTALGINDRGRPFDVACRRRIARILGMDGIRFFDAWWDVERGGVGIGLVGMACKQ
jgi:hypothetical protein